MSYDPKGITLRFTEVVNDFILILQSGATISAFTLKPNAKSTCHLFLALTIGIPLYETKAEEINEFVVPESNKIDTFIP